jgi:hypothetical protein
MVASGFYGFAAISIFHVSTENKPWSWRVHQLWLNFLGALCGWTALFVLVHKLGLAFREGGSNHFAASDFGLFLVAFIGVTGYLPRTLVGVAAAPSEVLAKLVAGK